MAGLIETGTVTVNAAFLQEIKEVNQELWTLLKKVRHACNRPIPLASNGRHLVAMLVDLRDQLALHFSLEEAFGYFEDPVEVNPRVAHDAERLRGEHRKLYSSLSQIVDHAETLLDEGDAALLAATIPTRFLAFDAALQSHEASENELLMSALDEDLGGGD